MEDPADFQMQVTMTAERDRASLRLPAEVTLAAVGLESFTAALAQVRASMAPEVPRDMKIGVKVSAIGDPRYFVSPEPMMGGVLLSIRHPGFGWLHFQIPTPEIPKLTGFLNQYGTQGAQPPATKN